MTSLLTKLKVFNNLSIITRMKHDHAGQHGSCDVVAVPRKSCKLCRNKDAPRINWNNNDQIPKINLPNKIDYMHFIIADHIEKNKLKIKKIKDRPHRKGVQKWKSAYLCEDFCHKN